jgi:8-oxo-dGTP diphosphatase
VPDETEESPPAPDGPTVVVAAAILDGHRLLAAQRARPASLAGSWELPGGKVEPGESAAAALVRECEEELGARIELIDRMPGLYPLGSTGGRLVVWTARVADGEPQPRALADHLAVRWLEPEDWDSVGWLPADRPVIADLRRLLLSSGGS